MRTWAPLRRGFLFLMYKPLSLDGSALLSLNRRRASPSLERKTVKFVSIQSNTSLAFLGGGGGSEARVAALASAAARLLRAYPTQVEALRPTPSRGRPVRPC